jgi:hypothetical protein
VSHWHDAHPCQDIPDGQVFTQPWPAHISREGPRHPGSGDLLPVPPDRARRTLHGIDEQVAKAEKAVDGRTRDLQARPVYHHKRESIEAHLTIVFAP